MPIFANNFVLISRQVQKPVELPSKSEPAPVDSNKINAGKIVVLNKKEEVANTTLTETVKEKYIIREDGELIRQFNTRSVYLSDMIKSETE